MTAFEKFPADISRVAERLVLSLSRELEPIRERLDSIDQQESDKIMCRIRAARSLPEKDKRRDIWDAVGQLTPRELALFWRSLPDPLKRSKRGRPPGSRKYAPEDVEALDKRIGKTGEPPLTAARALTRSTNEARHLVRLWIKRGF